MAEAGRRLLKRDERVEVTLRAAARLFARNGFEATTMDAIAHESGVTRLILYRHFAGKRELYEAVLERVRARLRELAEPLCDEELRPGRPELIRILLAVGRDDPDGFLLLFRETAREPAFAAYAREHFALLASRAESRLGGSVADPLQRRVLARAAIRATVEAVVAWIEEGDADRDEEFVEETGRALSSIAQGSWVGVA